MFISFRPVNKSQRGFSLIELLLVVTVMGVLAVVAIPSITKAKRAAQTGAVIGNLKTFGTHQAAFMSVKGRYARITELNSFVNNSLGLTSGRSVYQGEYRYRNYPSTSPTDTSLKSGFGILATRIENGYFALYIVLDEDGRIIIYET